MIYILPTNTCFWLATSVNDVKSYEKIYKIKKRSFSNPLVIMVQDFKWLTGNTDLNDEQIAFLKTYDKPFTVVTNSSSLEHWMDYKDEHWVWFQNSDVYSSIAFRIAHNDEQEKLIKKIWPIFLTSANLSWEWEIFDIKTIKEVFSYHLDKKNIELLSYNDLKKNNSSDIFEFIWEGIELNYFRKN